MVPHCCDALWSLLALFVRRGSSPLWSQSGGGFNRSTRHPSLLIWHVGTVCIWRDMHGHGSRGSRRLSSGSAESAANRWRTRRPGARGTRAVYKILALNGGIASTAAIVGHPVRIASACRRPCKIVSQIRSISPSVSRAPSGNCKDRCAANSVFANLAASIPGSASGGTVCGSGSNGRAGRDQLRWFVVGVWIFVIEPGQELGGGAGLSLRCRPVDLPGRLAVIAAGVSLHDAGIDGEAFTLD